GNSLLVRPYDHAISLHDHLERTLLVDGVGVGFVVGANRFVATDLDLRRIAAVHAQVASDVIEQYARILSDGLLLGGRVIERLSEHLHRMAADAEGSPGPPELEHCAAHDAQQN